jgi:hypothetical protein
MSNEELGLGASRRTPRQGVGGSPVGSWLTIALAVVAVVAGFLILRNITDDGGSASTGGTGQSAEGDGVAGPATTLIDVELPDATTTTTSTTVPRVTAGSSVVVANANTVGGSAGNMTKTLELQGYTMVDPVNASGPNVSASIVYYDAAVAAAQDVAKSVASDLGGVEVLVVSSPAPTESGDLGDAGVLVLLGDDQAGKTIEELSGSAGDAAATDAVEAPDVSDGDVPITAPADADTGGDAETDTTEG